MKRKIKNNIYKYKLKLAIFSAIITIPLVIIFAFGLYFQARIYPGVTISGVSMGTQTISEAQTLLKAQIPIPEKITLNSVDNSFQIPTSDFDFSINYQNSVQNAYYAFRSGNLLSNAWGIINSAHKGNEVLLSYNLDEEKLTNHLHFVADQIVKAPVHPSVSLINGNIVVIEGELGSELDIASVHNNIIASLTKGLSPTITLTPNKVDPTLSEIQKTEFNKFAQSYLNKNIVLDLDGQQFDVPQEELLYFLHPAEQVNAVKVKNFIDEYADQVDTQPQNSVFNFENGIVAEFIPSRDGQSVDRQLLESEFTDSIVTINALATNELVVDVPHINTRPNITTEEVNDLGIVELIGKGDSIFKGSISSRIHNIGVASNKFSGSLIAPGEVFSFNNTLGDVSEYTGYQKAYIIKDGKTILGDGGGVCQVSTTFFRAALDAGLPIVERRPHSYRVTYYEQDSSPGLDATVYAPTTDLKIKNDTPAHILIQTYFDPKKASLTFEIYGTSDGRIANISKPVISSTSPPPEDLYTDDPTLQLGEIKQVDWKAWGAKVNFVYEVEKNGEIIYEKTFYSNYRPWQAKFLRGTAH